MVKILISGAGTATCQGVIKGLLKIKKRVDLEIHTMDPNKLSAGRFLGDKFHEVPLAHESQFIPELLNIVKKEKIDLFIPIVDYEFEKLAAGKQLFKNIGCTVAICDLDTLKIVNNKLFAYEFFKQKSIPTPETKLFCLENLAKCSFPMIIKPIDGRASIDIYKINDKDDFDYFLKKKSDNMLIQDYCEGDEYTVDFICDFNGKLIGYLPRVRIETKSGVSYKGKTFKDHKLKAYIQLITQSLNYIGPGNAQFMNHNGDYEIIEINPRFSGGLPLSIAAGMNSPAILIDLFLNNPLNYKIDSFSDNLYMTRYWNEVFVHEDNL